MSLAGWAPSGGAGSDGVAGEIGFTFGADPAFFPAVLEKPVFRRNVGDVASGGEAVDGGSFIFFSDMFEGAEGDEASGFSHFRSI